MYLLSAFPLYRGITFPGIVAGIMGQFTYKSRELLGYYRQAGKGQAEYRQGKAGKYPP